MRSAIPASLFYKVNIRKSGGVDIRVPNRGCIRTPKETPNINSREGLGNVLRSTLRLLAQNVLNIDLGFV